eukprot:m.274951 g.274951  ORF g.274951 m.274951 type:complete len:280 (-) comp16291_c0_seq4:1628-2467(-)
MSVAGKVCVVTGAGSGIGAALASKLAEHGAAAVMMADIQGSKVKSLAASLRNSAGESIGAWSQTDCSSEMSIRTLIRKTEHELGPIDFFFSNAGIPSNGGVEVPNEEWELVWNVNVMSHIFVARHLFPLYKERGGGVFVVTASAAGLLTQVGSLPYSVSKHAAVSVAEWLAITHQSDNIEVFCLCPQAVRTGFIPDDGNASSGGVAGMDGVLEPAQVAEDVLASVARKEFLILPHKSVKKYFQNKAKDYDRWIVGMSRLHEKFGDWLSKAPNFGSPGKL